jgi:glyoxylase-like metal-dependent hydrolase (beta-lactamase superfamily II)
MPFRHSVLPLLVVLLLWGCSPDRTSWDAAQRAIAAMGPPREVQGVRTLTFSGGEGTRTRLGQSFDSTGTDPAGTLSAVVTTLDFAGGRAAFEYDIALPGGFRQHRIEVLTTYDGSSVGYSINDNGRMASTPGGLFSWGPQNSPRVLLDRNPVRILLDTAVAESGGTPLEDVEFNGDTRRSGTVTTSWGETLRLYFDPDNELLVGFDVLDTEPMMGDVDARYLLSDYRTEDGLLLPHRLTILKDGAPFSDIRYETIAVNGPDASGVFSVPEDLEDQAGQAASRSARGDAWVPLAWNPVAGGVVQVAAYSHHSMVVEFPSFVAVVEAPYTEAQSLALAALIEQRIPGKPIRYVAPTHPHWDHTGGLRGIESLGATVLVATGQEARMREILAAPHTHPPDSLERARQAGAAGGVEVWDRTWSVSDGGQSLVLYAVSGSPHVEPMVLAWVPSSRVLFESDLFSPGTGTPATPASEQLEEAIRDLGLEVETLVGGHGGVGPFSELVAVNAGN